VRWRVENDGFAIVEDVFAREECKELIALLGPVDGAGRRNLLQRPEIAALAESAGMLKLVQPYLGGKARAVRGIYFDKTAAANWSVTWHQDLLIPVREKVEAEGFGPWSMKAGVVHVQPPSWVLEQMLTVRLHLDDTDEANGALRVVPGSHRHGVLSSEAMDDLCSSEDGALCCVRAGGALLMRPLLLHSSRKSSGDRHRRVLHIEYAGCDLPDGLRWA
jgi:hypothetical protein